MAMERQDYPAMLPQLQPPQAVNILNERVQQVGKLNIAIADWLLERRRIEEQYSLGLRRLAQRQLEGLDLGVFSVPWTSLVGSADTLADSHSALASKIEVDVERPLREFGTTNREMTAMSTVQGNLAAMAKDVEKASQKTDKLKGKGEKAEAGKVASANSDLDTAQSQWESQAPFIFENLQALDEARLNNLRDVLTQFQTHEVDQVERTRVTAEQCLNVLLNVETADEIKTFALKAVSHRPTLSGGRRNSSSIATPSRAIQSPVQNIATPPTVLPNDTLSREISSTPSTEKQKGRLKGLKRLSTVMGRRPSKQPWPLPPTTESSEPRGRPSPFSSLSGRLTRSRDNVPTQATLADTSTRALPQSPPRIGSEIFQPSSIAPAPAAESLEPPPQTNGTSAAAALAVLNGNHEDDLYGMETPKPAQRDVQAPLAVAESSRDSEGFSVPSQAVDPITQAQQEAASTSDGAPPQFNVNIRDKPIEDESGNSDAAFANVANKLSAPPTTIRRAGTARGRRQDRNSTTGSSYIPPEQAVSETPAAEPSAAREVTEATPIQTIAPAVQSTPETMSAGGLTQSPLSSFAPGQVAASTSSPFSSLAEQSSPLRPDSRAQTTLDQSRTDSQSIRSSTTAGSQGAAKHPELNETGLNSSVVETVSARFDNGKLTSSSLIGEIALAYNPADFSSPFGSENIRLENFPSLEKVAPNPAFISQIPDKDGEYSVNLASLAKTQVAFKYQVRLDDTASQAPLLVAPAFKIEPSQLSVIISYSLNPSFALQGRDSITLSNVTLALSIEGAKASSCLSRPVGTFSRDRNLIFWQLNDVTLTPGAAAEKLLARFATESEAKGGSVETRWEISSDSAQSLGSGLSVSMQSQSGAVEGVDPFADESANQAASWKAVQGVKKLVSGSYVAK